MPFVRAKSMNRVRAMAKRNRMRATVGLMLVAQGRKWTRTVDIAEACLCSRTAINDALEWLLLEGYTECKTPEASNASRLWRVRVDGDED